MNASQRRGHEKDKTSHFHTMKKGGRQNQKLYIPPKYQSHYLDLWQFSEYQNYIPFGATTTHIIIIRDLSR